MSAASAGVVPIEVARLAVEVQAIKGELALVTSTVGQQVQTLTTLVHEIQAEQLRARDERQTQTLLLSGLSQRAESIPDSTSRMQQLELKVSHWRGVFVGFSILAMLVAGGSVAWVTGQFQAAAGERAKLELRLDRLEHRP